ncbi:hypothetical protein SDC9_149909 [bioreactor metagenome]|uniref:Uncharacterized protein n=1 Tax=bioreactor metagenome TaxID=1076179 RepID=A0A645EQ89_9ZZZZ|nr:hypothetical protein [Sphaerochaeta sp.]
MSRATLGRVCLVLAFVLLLVLFALPPLSSMLLLIRSGELQFDYLLSAELGWIVMVAAPLLMIGAFLKGRSQGILATSLSLIALLLLFLLMMLRNPPYVLAIVLIVLYNLNLLALLVAAYRFLR